MSTTACKWDSVIPFEPLWEQYKRLIKPNGAIVLFGSQPFTTDLIMSNRAWFRYEWIWSKKTATGGALSHLRPMKSHENICVFGLGTIAYNPQLENFSLDEIKKMRKHDFACKNSAVIGSGTNISTGWFEGKKKNPKSVIEINGLTPVSSEKQGAQHPTQKPVALLEYLVRTYTNEGDLLLDNTCGSGSLLVAARNTNRRAVGIEMDEGYCRIAAGRLGRFEPSEFEVDKRAVEGQLGLFGAIA